MLHAGAVILANNRVVGIIGASGWGKSTLVSSFYQNGAQLITDDCLLLEFEDSAVFGTPNYSGIRLFDDSAREVFGDQYLSAPMAHYSDKQRVLLDKEADIKPAEKVQVDALFLLENPDICIESDAVTITSVKSMHELMTLIGQTFVLDVTDKVLMGEQFNLCGRIIDSGLPLFRLGYPHDHNRLNEVRKAIEHHV